MTWHKRMFCKCGWSDAPSFGDEWFTRTGFPACPSCGSDASTYKMRVVRWKRTAWFKGEWEARPSPAREP